MKKTHFYTILIYLITTAVIQAQPPAQIPQWAAAMYAPNPNIDSILEAYNIYYQSHPFEKNEHTQYLKRWQRELARSPYWAKMNQREKEDFLQKQKNYLNQHLQNQQQRSPSSQWQGIGPFDFDKTAASTSYACGAAHVYTVEKSAANPSLLYAGTATAGVWKSTDNGKNWTLTTRDLMITTVRAIELDHSNSQIAYAGSDLDGKLYKTTDGGSTWQVMGDTAFSNLHHNINDIVMHPDFNNILFLTSNNGLYRTDDGGATWAEIMSGTFQEIEFHPYLFNILYVIKQINTRTEFYKSTDTGFTFTQKTNGWPIPPAGVGEQKRTEIAVSLADSNKIYALLTGGIGLTSGLYGIFISNDAGESWSSTCCGAHLPNYPSTSNPNLTHWNDDGTGNGGQYYYDLALAVAPNDADSVLVAGVNLWFSTDGANSFSCPAQWNHSYKNNYVHADIHDVRFYGSEIWVACDGGIFYSDNNGLTFQQRMTGIQGTDFWGFGAGFQDGEVMLGGTFHNGTMLKDNQVYNTGWISTDGGDNYRGFVHPIHTRMVFSDFGKKQLSGNRAIPNLNLPFLHPPHPGQTVGFAGNMAFHPQIYNTLYTTDYYYLWKSPDNGLTWEQIYSFGSGLITSLEIAWSNPNILYLNYHPANPNADRKIYRSTNGGQTWSDITPNTSLVPNNRWVTYDLTISAIDANTLWAARVSKYEGTPNLDGYLVYKSTDGGQTWQNITTPDLDGVYLTNIEHQKGSAGGVYIGSRNAVYYKNDNMPNWVLYNSGLPARTHSVQLVPYYKKGKLRNGTSRSVYEVDFYENTPPVAQISVHQKNSNCPRDTFYFASHSVARGNATYFWQFAGGTPSSSTLPNPKVVFNNAGNYSVTLTVTDSLGTDAQVLSNFINITNDCGKDTLAGYALHLNTDNDYVITNPLKLQTNRITLSAWIKPDSIQVPFTGIITHANDSFPAGLLLGNNNELIFQWAGAQWNWNSGLVVPADEWSHVAVVISPDSARVYLNGVGVTYQPNLSVLNWKDGVVIGRYANWFARNFKGWIDEVCIWNAALTQDQIRASQHLTKYDAQQPNLIHYYQFNSNTTLAMDGDGILHGTFVAGANLGISTAPVGGGSSQKIIVQNAGNYTVPNAFARLYFNNSGSYPDGEIVVNRLNVSPDQIASNNLATNGYWILNNYGNNQNFTALDSLVWLSPNALNSTAPNYTLYQRPSRAEGYTWGTSIDTCDMISNNQLAFSAGLQCNYFGQFMTTLDSLVFLPNTPLVIQTNEISVFPNPIENQGLLNIQTKENDDYQLFIYNMNGKKVFESSFVGNAAQIQLPNLAAGAYQYRVQSEKRIWNGIFINR